MPLKNVHGKLLSNLFGKYSDAYEKRRVLCRIRLKNE